MKERPILFSAPMVRALLEGRKTQTRRACGDRVAMFDGVPFTKRRLGGWESGLCRWHCPYGVPGDRLWVRETWGFDGNVRADFRPYGPRDLSGMDLREHVVYRADIPAVSEADERRTRRAVKDVVAPWRPSIYMPRWASRITLEVTEVRVQRLWDINGADAYAEGCSEHGPEKQGLAVHGFARLWRQINGSPSWEANPWVWAISFRPTTDDPGRAAGEGR